MAVAAPISSSHEPSVDSRIALFLPCLVGRGVERAVLNLAEELHRRGHGVDLLLDGTDAPCDSKLPIGPKAIPIVRGGRLLSIARVWRAHGDGRLALMRPIFLPVRGPTAVRLVGGLADYLRVSRPAVLVSSKPHANLAAIWARSLAHTKTRIVIWEHSPLRENIMGSKRRKWRWRYLAPLARDLYRQADEIVAVSDGVADDLAQLGVERARIHTIYNPVVSARVSHAATAPLDHPWFSEPRPPVILAVGRITESKDFATLVRAFAHVRATRASRLVILGEAKPAAEKRRLEKLATDLRVRDAIEFTGFVDNPYAYMARADVLVCASKWEGFGNVLVEALACGCPIVSTDCPGGPAEILDNGKFGRLVPVGDDAAMAEAILSTFDQEPRSAELRQRASQFTVASATDRFLGLLALGCEAVVAN